MHNPFYIKIQKEFKRSTQDQALILKHIEKFVLANKGENVEIRENQLKFKISFLGWSWDYFALIDRGHFIIENNRIIFRFIFYKGLIFILPISFIVAYQSENIFACLPFIFGIFINYIAALVRYKRMLTTIVNEIYI